ncbi:MAG: phosphatidate cytidylyltransferase [Clostridiaceae bacterium]|jgi:phosphatidate cytidylyltransferase|nr:phosphatidate cytidylyltransferase [Clostridiaceae bacterium]
MLTRVISGVAAAAILVSVLLLPPVILAIAVLIISCVGLYEYAGAMKHRGIKVDLGVSFIAAVLLTARAYITTSPGHEGSGPPHIMDSWFSETALYALVFLAVVFLFCRVLFGSRKLKLDDAAHTMLAIAYIPFLLSHAIMIRNMERGFEHIWLVIIGASVTDIFAYFAGTFFGKHKIIPAISPKKTVEGAIGGVVGCAAVMTLYGVIAINHAAALQVDAFHFAILGLFCGILSQVSDWSASSIKRAAGVKDFGRIIPGHGGIMDRCDSYLFVTPVIYFYIRLFF